MQRALGVGLDPVEDAVLQEAEAAGDDGEQAVEQSEIALGEPAAQHRHITTDCTTSRPHRVGVCVGVCV